MTTGPRRVVAEMTTSLDGFVAGPGGDMSWLVETALDVRCASAFEGFYRGTDTVVLGRRNYEGFHGYWPPVADDPEADPRSRDLSRWLTAVDKVVVSRTITTAAWANTRVTADLEGEVTALRDGPGRDIAVLGSVSVVGGLLRAGLLDELRLTVVPALLGDGLRLFEGAIPPSTWELLSLATVPTGAVIGHYRRRTG